MSLVDDLSTLRLRFYDQWNTDDATAVYDNSSNTALDDNAPWVRFSIRHGDVQRGAFGPDDNYRYGRVWLQVFVPRQSGTTIAINLADKFAAIFRNWRSDDHHMQCSTETITTLDHDPKWYQVNISIPFEAR